MVNEHGGNIYGKDIRLDFSANLNPLGMPASVKNAAAAAVCGCDRYPDPFCRKLTEKLSAHENIPAENIVCGNGADDLIYRIVHAVRPESAVIGKPTFSEYAKALREAGCAVSEYAPGDISASLVDSTDMVILCNPNNPTGTLTGCGKLKEICEKSLEKNIIFLCDECFIDLCKDAEKNSAKQYMNKNVIVLKAFTKTYAMPGLRLGYALFGDTGLAAKVRGTGQFWSVSAVAQAAGEAALDEREYVAGAVELIAEERRYLSEMLKSCGFTVCPSDANFILFRCDVPLDAMLLNEGILIRNCVNFDGLGEGYFRIAVRTHEENKMLAETMKKVMKWQEK